MADANGVTYKVEKYCYSNPINMEADTAEEGGTFDVVVRQLVENADGKGNNKFRFRVGAVYLISPFHP